MPAFRIELSVPRLSEPVEAAGLLVSVAEAVRRKATVQAEVSGPAPLTGRRLVRPAGVAGGGRQVPGAALLRRADALRQGGGGLSRECTIEDRHIRHAVDRDPTAVDKDPEIDVDPAAGVAVLADGAGRGRWSVTFGLEAPP